MGVSLMVASWAALSYAAQAAPSAPPPPAPLHEGDRLTRTLTPNQVASFPLEMARGDLVRVELREIDGDFALTLRNPQGDELARADSGNLFGRVEVIVEAADQAGSQGGTHVLEVKLSGSRAASFELSLPVLRPRREEDARELEAHRRFRAATLLRRQPDTRAAAVGELLAAARLFGELQQPLRRAGALLVLANVYQQQGELRLALAQAEQARWIYQIAKDLPNEAITLANIAFCQEALGEPPQARAAYLRALDMHRAAKQRDAEALTLNNLGFLEKNLGRRGAALAYYQQALPIARETGDRRREGIVLQNMGAIHSGLGEFATANRLFREALPLHRTAGNKPGEAQTLFALGLVAERRGQSEEASDLYGQALRAARVAGDGNLEVEAGGRLGYVLASLGRHAEAGTTLEQALTLARASQNRSHRAGVFEAAGRAALFTDAALATARANEALAEYRAIGNRVGEASALDTLARAHNARGELPVARARIEESLAILEESRTQVASPETRASYFATQQGSFSFYIDLLMRQRAGDPRAPAQALAAVERSRARSLLDLLAESGADIRQGVDAKLLAQERDLAERLHAKAAVVLARRGAEAARLREEIRAIDEEYRQVQSAIRRASPAYAALTQPEPLTLERMQELLDSETVLLEYSLGDTRSYLWAVGRRSLAYWELPGRSRIEPQVERVYQLLTARAQSPRGELPAERHARIAAADAELATAARELRDSILPPGAVAPGQRLVIAPDGALQRLPFAMLPMLGGEPLGIGHEITIVPSATALAVQRQELSGRPPAARMLAVFADPDFAATATGEDTAGRQDAASTRILEHLGETPTAAGGRPRVPPLPFTRNEARDILAVSRGPNFAALGREATREKALDPALGGYRYLHFATHGYLDTERPGLSALLLAGEGFLRVNDIYNLRLPAELVVLSACQTGLGQEVRGEGLMSFTRAFMYAGAPRVIVSLWNVNDRATASLMTTLYRRMLGTGLTPPAALRQAQIELRRQKQWESPYYWAAFLHYGEWKQGLGSNGPAR